MFCLLWRKLNQKLWMQRAGPSLVIVLMLALSALILRSDSGVVHRPILSDEVITHPVKPGSLKIPIEETLTYKEMFQEIGARYDLEWPVLEALAYHESRMDYLATGRSDEMGLMQIAPLTWDEWAAKIGASDPFDPYSNISVGAAYLAFVRDLCTAHGHSEPHCMLVAYNWGPNRLARFFENGGTWEQVPAIRRKYATDIIQMANTRSLNSTFFDQLYAGLIGDE